MLQVSHLSPNFINSLLLNNKNKYICWQQASELVLDKDKGWEKGEEHVLGFHLLEFTEVRQYRN